MGVQTSYKRAVHETTYMHYTRLYLTKDILNRVVKDSSVTFILWKTLLLKLAFVLQINFTRCVKRSDDAFCCCIYIMDKRDQFSPRIGWKEGDM